MSAGLYFGALADFDALPSARPPAAREDYARYVESLAVLDPDANPASPALWWERYRCDYSVAVVADRRARRAAR